MGNIIIICGSFSAHLFAANALMSYQYGVNMEKKKKVVVIGLDGGTWDIIAPMVRKGDLPVIEQLMKAGTCGPLRSTIHPTTPHAWSSFITGKNAGKHGIFDFTERRPGTYDVRLINGGFRREKSLWRLLGERQKKVIVLNVPFTYPAEEVNGVLIAGLDAPWMDGKFAYPQDVYDEIVNNVGRYDLRGTFPIGKTKKWYNTARLESVIQNRVDVARYLMETRDWDFLMTVFGSTDHVQHMFWRYMEAKDNGSNGGDVDAYGHIIRHTYRLVDRGIGEIISKLDEDTAVILMSDHGAGPIKNIVYLNKWLEQEGLLHFKSSGPNGSDSVYRRLIFNSVRHGRFYIKRFLPPGLKGMLKRLLSGIKDKAESFLYFSKIDWTKTRAYAYGMYGNININLRGREPLGIVAPGHDCNEITQRIISRLKALRHPMDNSRVVDCVYRCQELFSGDLADKAPDLLIAWKDYEYFSRVTMDDRENAVFGSLFNIDSSDFEYSGTHRLNGIFLCKGQGIKAGAHIADAQILDVAPTILHLMGQSVPEDMDGRVLGEMFAEAYQRGNPVTFSKTEDAVDCDVEKGLIYSDQEEEEIAERLRGLGYIE